MTVASRIGVMDAGQIAQVASPRDLYEAPVSRWIASFVGDVNLFEGRIASREAGRLTVSTQDAGPIVATAPAEPPAKEAVAIAVRPEKIKLARRGAATGAASAEPLNRLEGVITEVGYLGGLTSYKVRLDSGSMVRASLANTARLDVDAYSAGQPVEAWFRPGDCVVLER